MTTSDNKPDDTLQSLDDETIRFQLKEVYTAISSAYSSGSQWVAFMVAGNVALLSFGFRDDVVEVGFLAGGLLLVLGYHYWRLGQTLTGLLCNAMKLENRLKLLDKTSIAKSLVGGESLIGFFLKAYSTQKQFEKFMQALIGATTNKHATASVELPPISALSPLTSNTTLLITSIGIGQIIISAFIIIP
jgi:hypothetical protein